MAQDLSRLILVLDFSVALILRPYVAVHLTLRTCAGKVVWDREQDLTLEKFSELSSRFDYSSAKVKQPSQSKPCGLNFSRIATSSP